MLNAADLVITENGKARAEIIISEKPQRSVRLAAQELQDQIAKISGARLPILTQPTGRAVKVFIGAHVQSPAKADGLKAGAYKIVTGEDWMALIGDDTDFTPPSPYAQNNADIHRAQLEWEALSNARWGMPSAGLYKNRLKVPGRIGKPEGAVTEKNETLDVWAFDERGSFNAVYGVLHKIGARWYLPGELGEVLPSIKTICLPQSLKQIRA